MGQFDDYMRSKGIDVEAIEAAKEARPYPGGVLFPDQDWVPEGMRNFDRGIRRGLEETGEAVQQGLTHSWEGFVNTLWPDSDAAKWATNERKRFERERRIDQARYDLATEGSSVSGPARFAGSMVGPAGAGAAAKAIPVVRKGLQALPAVPRGVVQGGGVGAADAALRPVDVPEGGSYGEEKATEMTQGAAGGAVTGGLIPTATGLIAGRGGSGPRRDLATEMADAGAPLTPGQALGPGAQAAEQRLASYPLVGQGILKAREAALSGYNVYQLNKILAPLGKKVSTREGGYDANAEAARHVSNAYDDVFKNLDVPIDLRANRAIVRFEHDPRVRDPDVQGEVENVLQKFNSTFDRAARENPGWKGEEFGNMDSMLRHEAEMLRADINPRKRALGDAVDGLRQEMIRAMGRADPQRYKKYRDIKRAYAEMQVIEQAAANVGSRGGVWSPAAVLGASKKSDRSMRKKRSARGEGVLQREAEAAEDVLGKELANSQTADRMLMHDLAHVALTGGTAAIPKLTGLGIGATAYAPGVSRYLANAALGRNVGGRLFTSTLGSPAQIAGARTAQEQDFPHAIRRPMLFNR